jgi:hypothetical protein
MDSIDQISFLDVMGTISFYLSGADTRPTTKPTKIPIVFIHGNSDVGAGDGAYGTYMTGFSS